MNKILFLAPSNSIHAKKWIESQITDELEIIWYSFYKKTYEIDKRIKYKEFKSNSFLQIIASLFIFLNKINNDNILKTVCNTSDNIIKDERCKKLLDSNDSNFISTDYIL